MIWICADILIKYIFIFMVKISMALFKYVIHASIKDDSITPIGGVWLILPFGEHKICTPPKLLCLIFDSLGFFLPTRLTALKWKKNIWSSVLIMVSYMTDLRVVVTFVQINWCQMVWKMCAPFQNICAKYLTTETLLLNIWPPPWINQTLSSHRFWTILN